ncbi:hypothetical protein ACO22_06678 [Paracoccidioides brasiliensis]|uniref:Major facilitator superfamily (MFS) profile domain-containing protein n=1 Tax=Paracoccidioides brasiliensis TaxID=121759 RepID=A0A1D2J6U8_PARBR|nr:hypothetical protein ACO22_06678 [Paracoccidioides brasiliensis]
MTAADEPSLEPRESTPLLRGTPAAAAFHENPNGLASDGSLLSNEVDEESLDLDLAKVQSIPHGGEVEPGFPPAHQGSAIAPNYGSLSSEAVASQRISSKVSGQANHFINVTPAQFWTIFGGILFSYLIAFFDSTLMGSIHPVITSHFHATNSASWLSTAFLLTCTAFQPVIGRLSDTFGRRPLYLVTIFIFFVTTAWCALAQSIGSFIAARAFGGLGAGAVTSLGMIISSDLIWVEYRGIYQSYINFCYGTGGSLGLALGGVLADSFGWRAAFGIQLPFIFVYLVVAYYTTPASLGPELAKNEGYTLRQAMKTIDIRGSSLLVVCVTALMLGINLGGNIFSWSHPLVISSLVVSGVLAALFVKVEATANRPAMPLPLLHSAPRANLIVSNFFGNIAINTVLFNAPLFFQAVKLESPSAAGIRLLSSSLGLLVTSVSTGFLVTWSRRLTPTLILGFACLLCSGIFTSMLGRDVPTWIAMILIAPSGCGQGFAFPTTMLSVLAVSAQDEQAVVTTTLGLFRNLGSVMGVAISSWALQNALLYYLDGNVSGPDRADIIRQVRRSISAISHLDPLHKTQVVHAYELALRATFLSGIISAVIALALVVPIKLPRLRRKEQNV